MKMRSDKVFETIEKHLGFPSSRCRTVANRLRDERIWPAGSVGVSPDVEAADVAALILALATEARLNKVGEAVRHYAVMTPGGTDLSGAPARIKSTASGALIAIALEAVDGRPVKECSIEIVSSWPELAIHWQHWVTDRYQPVGALSGHWGGSQQRRAITFSGKAFAAVFQELFK